DPAQVAGAVDRYLALREFRARLYGCLTARADALFELCDAILCADHAVTSLVQLSLVPEFRRGHGALYDALAAGQVDEGALAALPSARRAAVMSITMPAAATAPARPSRAGSTSSSRRWGTCAPRGPRWSMSSAPRPPPGRSRPPGRYATCCAACTRPGTTAAAPRWSSWTPGTAPPP